ncbi:Tetratricopeptide repeat protein [Planctomycetes bacterium Pla163]|uniref:Tetratricopeptide repeat protein n=1 Tax=Rohdeia mirabilis TaxID=2528008 RepID=A0A518D142_9BACT|nr:Tetratricopeptide repeat protein [Planctomycetes bacterium Pla163]
MTDPKLRIALAATAGLLPGLIVGFLAAPEDGPVSSTRSSTSQVDQPAGGTDARDAQRPEPITSVERPTADVVAESTRRRPSGSDPDPTLEWTLVDELKELLASGRVETMAGQDPQGLRALLVRLHVQLGDAAGALALIESFADIDSNQRYGLYDHLVDLAFTDAPEVAALAAERAMRTFMEGLDGTEPPTFSYPYDHYLTQLRTLDPQRSLELLAELRALGLQEGISLTMFEIEALSAAGRGGQALALAQTLLENAETVTQGLIALTKIDPVQGEVELRKHLDGPNGAWARGTLISMLSGQGRSLEAIELFEEALANGSADAALWGQFLNGIPRKYVDAMIDDWLATGDTGYGALQSVANYYQSQGDTWATLDAYEQLWNKALETGAWLQQLPWDVIKAHPTESLALLDQAAAQLGDNDEMWGDLADTYWQAGATNEALAAWEKAKALDPNDSEWTNKLEAAANGQNPIWMQPDSQLGDDVADLYPQPAPLEILNGGYASQGSWLGGFGYEEEIYFSNDSFIEFGGEVINVGMTHSIPGSVQVFGDFDSGGIEVLESLGYSDGE